MELNFVKDGTKWVSSFEATSDFNLHIERNKGGFLFVSQRTTPSGEYDSTKGADFSSSDLIIDYDFSALVYPKFIKVVCEVEPTFAEVISNGEVTEIKAQSKEIEVTSNGTTNVTPDEGFAYLNSVKVKTNVATSGEGGGGAVTKYAYFSYQDLTSRFGEFAGVVFNNASFVKMYKNEVVTITPVLLANWSTVIAVAVDLSFKVVYDNGTIMSTADDIAYWVDLQSVTQLTEEEFYNTDVSSPSTPE